jgi:hypothetical protein
MTSSNTTSPNTGPARRRTTPMLRQLDREWGRIRQRPQTLRQARTWAGDPRFRTAVESATSLDDIVAATQPIATSPGSGDAILRRLVELSEFDDLAGRVVLQRLVPGLISRARRWVGHAGMADPTDIIIGAAWLAIRHFDVHARSRHLAPALIADALWIGFRRDTRRFGASEVPVAGPTISSHPAPSETTDSIIALAATVRAAARAGVPAADLDLIRTIAMAGGPTSAARECKVTVRTIRNRRDVAAERIRTALGSDWADWSDPMIDAA